MTIPLATDPDELTPEERRAQEQELLLQRERAEAHNAWRQQPETVRFFRFLASEAQSIRMQWSKGDFRDQGANFSALGAISVLRQLTDPSDPNYITYEDLEEANV